MYVYTDAYLRMYTYSVNPGWENPHLLVLLDTVWGANAAKFKLVSGPPKVTNHAVC